MAKLVHGVNDLQTTHPEIASQAHDWDPTTVTAGSHKKMVWGCCAVHPFATWESTVANRTNGRGCPVCACKKVLVGFNDLQTTHPEIAAQAHGWDPTTVTAGSNKKLVWGCGTGHPFATWDSPVNNRTQGSGCPVCVGQKVLVGFNDLQTTHPEIASQAHDWDPTTVTAGSDKKMVWACSTGHPLDTWETGVCNRTNPNCGTGCPVCVGQKVLVGFNDLQTTHPEISAQAHGWDPTTVTAGSGKKMVWGCGTGHPFATWDSVIADRTTQGRGCPVCVGQKVLVGFNDLQTTHPEIASQAHGWDPTTVTAGSGKKMVWECSTGHPLDTWPSQVCNRTNPNRGTGCPVCSIPAKKILVGFNDLQTTHPEIASQAHGWDPTTVTAGSHKKMVWECSTGHPFATWETAVSHRTQGTGCPDCTDYGYKKNTNGFIYLMERPSEQQIGITNDPEARIKLHQRVGWELIELAGPFSGELAWSREKEVKEWLKHSIGTIEGTLENWDTNLLRVNSLKDLYTSAGLSDLLC